MCKYQYACVRVYVRETNRAMEDEMGDAEGEGGSDTVAEEKSIPIYHVRNDNLFRQKTLILLKLVELLRHNC